MDRSGSKTNGHSSGTSAQPSSDLYKQLINNDMVKELDDIEAISQQISQHAEVLYNSWKTNGMTQGPQFKLSAAQAVSPSLDHSTNPLSQNLRERGGTLSARPENGAQQARQPSHYNTLRTTSYNDNGRVLTTTFAHEGRQSDDPTQINSGFSHNSLERQHSGPYSHNSLERHNSLPNQRASSDSSSSPRQSTVSSPTSSTRESPARGSSITHISHPSSLTTDVGPLELLASPNLNGNLEELVTSFVSTDKAKQAARNTISSTIMRRLGSPNGSASPVRSPSPTSTLSYRGASPLRSPMLTNTARSVSSPEPTSPRTSSTNMFPNEMAIPIQNQNRTASAFSLNSDIHAPMQSIFSKAPSPSFNHNAAPNSKTSLLQVQTERDQTDGIPIPVKHIPIAISLSTSEGLKSPSVLQNVNKNPFPLAVSKPNSEHMQMPNLFDDFGAVKDPETSILSMRKRFEEAKQRMALSLPAREGGVRPNSFTSMGRSLFDRDSDRMSLSPWGDDPSAFLLEQFRRRNKRRMEIPSAPHPELTAEQKQHISERSSGMQPGAPMRRMLPGGSVAERVLMFEKSPSAFGLDPVQVRNMPQRKEPTLTGTAITPWRSQMHDQLNKTQITGKKERIVPISKLESGPTQNHTPSSLSNSSQPLPVFQPPVAQTFPRRTTQPSTTFRPPSLHLPGKEEIPKFYFPNGNPNGKPSAENVCKKFTEAFSKYKNNCVTNEELGQILKVSGYPLFWKCPVFQSAGGDKAETISLLQLSKAWRRLVHNCHDEAAQFVSVLTQGARTHLVPEDMVPLIQDVVDTHPGLLFLKEATEFHSRYVHTVIARIFYEVNRSWSGKITVSELRRSKFLSTLRLLQDEDDINQVTDFFSYEHFYVIYCKFWELDKDHDLFIDREDLARHNDHALSTRMIERIFSGAVTRGSAQKEGRMSYTEFVWFLLSEEDKRHPTAIEYWFRCMDLDGDGVLSMYELEYFYEEQLQRMEQLGIETLPFDDCLCQMLDMIRPSKANNINLKDLKYCKMTPVFFDTFFNLEKYLDHEQRDPFATQRETDEDGNELSDWDRFAAEEYELLVAEEGNNEPMDDMCYEDGENPRMHMDESLDSEMIQHDPPGSQP